MRPTNFAFWLGSVAIAGLSGTASTAQQAPKSETAPCFNLSCPIEPVAEAPSKSETGAPDKPYDWRASFATYKVGRVPRTADGKPDLQGIWSRSILTPLERPGNESDETEYDPSVRAELEDAAQQRQFDLRTEPTNTPPGEKTTDAYNTFWRDGFWYKVPMTSLHTSQVVDPPNGQLPPLTPAAREQRARADYLLNRPATGPEDRPPSSRCVRPIGVGPPFTGSGPGGQESTLEIVQSPKAVIIRVEALRSQLIYLDGRPRLTERWKRLDDTHLLYGFTMDDPATRTKPYSIEFVMWRLTDQEQLVEYACHEGNVGLEFTLSGARAKEREEEEQQQKEQPSD